MRLSKFFLPLLKENPVEAQIVSHRLMLRAGLIKQEASGLYSWLPLGLRVLDKVETIVSEELEKAGCVRLLMPTLQSTDLWKESGRYDALGKEMLRFNDRHERELLYSPTCEEMIVNIFRTFVKSYKQLPLNLFQIQWKFRDEIRPRFGVMRGREFYMKDGYSFHSSLEDATREYANMYDAYHAIFKRLGLTSIAVAADSGAIGGNLSHEFQVLAENGESQVYYDPAFDDIRDGKLNVTSEQMRELYAAADELHDPAKCPVPADKLRTARGIEVGHIFLLGTKYTDAMNVDVTDADGKPLRVQMGTYGIGVSRLLGAIIEASHDEGGIIWPENVAPYQVGLINMRANDEECTKAAEEIYSKLHLAGVETLYDDTDDSAGKKFAGMDLIGLPWQLVVGPRGVKSGVVELKNRKTGEKVEVSFAEAIERVSATTPKKLAA
ncbi:MAG: proline--tRNA ligase [Alphaproteobacteria bacterium]|nr:proline--tRNA ligase [Alphaproteobacteria bacterium]